MCRNKLLLCVLFVFILNISNGQGVTAMMAYDSATQYREIADTLWNRENPTKQQLAKALNILQQGLAYLNQPNIFDLAQGNTYLKHRQSNIFNDIAYIYSILRQKDSTIQALKNSHNIGGYYYDFIEKDTAFEFIRNENEYKELIVAMQQNESLWKGDSLKSPFTTNLPLNEKIAGLSLLWSQAKYNFVHFDHANIDWNKQYLEYIDLVSQTKSTTEYYKILIKFYASLKDGHTNVYVPKELSDEFYTRPPFRTELIEDRVFVTDILSDTLQKMGVEKGIEIIAINGEPVKEYAKNNIEPYQSSSTSQDLEVRKFTYALLSGSKQKSLEIKFRNNKGKVWTQLVPRSGYKNISSTPSINYKEIDNIGYLELNSFSDQAVVKFYDSIFAKITNTKSLIIDLRKNGGGSGGIGFHILSTLTSSPSDISKSRIIQYNSTNGGDAQWYFFPPEKIYPSKKMYYAKPVIVLISARTFSAAEDFVVAFSLMKRGKLIGQATGGSTGQPLFFDLPGGGTARVCAKDDYFPNGKTFVGVGIMPDIYIKKTLSDLYYNKDSVLIKALELLK